MTGRFRPALLLGIFLGSAALSSPAIAGEVVLYTYDALGRLVATDVTGGPAANADSTATYDPAGNRVTYSMGGAAAPAAPDPSFSVQGPGTVTEGASAIFTITKSAQSTGAVSVNYATSSGSATSGSDFTATSGTFTFQSWETQRTVSVPTIDDGLAEPAETFSMTLSSPTGGATIGTASATATIAASSAPNQPPVANPDAASVKICQTVIVNVIANDTDPENNTPLTLVSVSTSSLGQSSVASTTSVQFDAYNATGIATLTYVVRDSLGATATGSLNIGINNGTTCNQLYAAPQPEGS